MSHPNPPRDPYNWTAPPNIPPEWYEQQAQAHQYSSGATASPPPPRKPRWRKILLAVLVGLALLFVLIGVTADPQPATPAAPPASNWGTSAVPSAVTKAAPVVAPAVTPATATGPARKITSREWKLIAKDPEAHAGERVIVYGQVMQFDAATGVDAFRANVDGAEHKPSYGYADYDTNTFLSGPATELVDLVEGDLFRAEVTVDGAYSYSTQIGGGTTAPRLIITKIKTIGHLD
jgi:hypothetical protein